MEVAVDILPATPRASTQGPPLPTTTSARQILPQSRQRRRHQATPLEKVFGSVLDHAGSRVQQPGWSSPQAGWNIAPTSNQTPRVLGRLGKKAILYDNPPRLVVAGPKKSWTMHRVRASIRALRASTALRRWISSAPIGHGATQRAHRHPGLLPRVPDPGGGGRRGGTAPAPPATAPAARGVVAGGAAGG